MVVSRSAWTSKLLANRASTAFWRASSPRVESSTPAASPKGSQLLTVPTMCVSHFPPAPPSPMAGLKAGFRWSPSLSMTRRARDSLWSSFTWVCMNSRVCIWEATMSSNLVTLGAWMLSSSRPPAL